MINLTIVKIRGVIRISQRVTITNKDATISQNVTDMLSLYHVRQLSSSSFSWSAVSNERTLTTMMGYLHTAVYILALVTVYGSRLPDVKNDNQVKIISGNNTTVSQYPFAVVFMVANKLWGAGTIIDKSWILTSAFNCLWVQPKYITIRIGSDTAEKDGEVFSAKKCIIHPKYKGFWEYDIALLHIKGNITFNNVTKQASLPTKDAASLVNMSLPVTGWGITTLNFGGRGYFHKSLQTVLKKKECLKIYKDLETSVCAYNSTSGPSAFDFGAPLSLGSNVVGVYQGSGNSTDFKNYPALYTNVYHFNKWIKTTLKNHGVYLGLETDIQGPDVSQNEI